MPECSTPLLCPVWCWPMSPSFSRTTSWVPGRRCRISRAAARPMMPPPMTATSNTWGEGSGWQQRGQRAPALMLAQADHVEGRRWAHESLQRQLAQRLQLGELLEGGGHLGPKEDLAVHRLVAEPRRSVGHRANGAVIH